MSEDQIIVCEGCGSRWRVDVAKGRASVIAMLVECPLCEQKEVYTDESLDEDPLVDQNTSQSTEQHICITHSEIAWGNQKVSDCVSGCCIVRSG